MEFDPLAPLGNTAQEAVAFVRAEIQRYLPPVWRVTSLEQRSPVRSDFSAFRGVIEPIEEETSGRPTPNRLGLTADSRECFKLPGDVRT